MYYLITIKDEGDGWNRLIFEDFEQLLNATKAAEKCDLSDNFEIHSDEWISHYLKGKRQPNGHIDWPKKPHYN